MIKLIKDRIAIVPLENPEMIGHIHIPDMAKTRTNQGFVKYVGPDVKAVTVGDYVLYSGYSGTLTQLEGEGKLIIMPEEFIIAHISRLPNVIIPGLYFKDSKSGEFFAADYENSLNLIAQAFSENPNWRNRFNVMNMEKPKLADYDKLKAGLG